MSHAILRTMVVEIVDLKEGWKEIEKPNLTCHSWHTAMTCADEQGNLGGGNRE